MNTEKSITLTSKTINGKPFVEVKLFSTDKDGLAKALDSAVLSPTENYTLTHIIQEFFYGET